MTEFRARLAALGVSQTELRRWIERITGEKIAQSTTSRWATGERQAPPEMLALLAVLHEPDLRNELRSRKSSEPTLGA